MSKRIPEKEESMITPKEVAEYNLLCRKYLTKWGYEAVIDCLVKEDILQGNIIDIGTGSGWLAIELIKKSKNYKVTGIDLSEEMLTLAKKNVRSFVDDSANIKFIKADAKCVPIEDSFFDAAVSYASLHHWSGNPLEVFKEAFRVVKNGGLIVIFDLKREEKNLIFVKSILSKIMRQLFEASLQASYTLGEIREILSSDTFTKDWNVVENPMSLGIIGGVSK